MRRLSKALLSLAVVSAASAAMAVSSMAADTITGTYDAATGVVTIEGAVSTGTSQTLLVLTSDAETVADTDIAQIDQTDDGSVFSQFVLPTGIESGTYYVRIGGDGTIQTGTITIGGGGGEETVTIIIGDVDLNNSLANADITQLARSQAGKTTGIGYAGETRKVAVEKVLDGTTLTKDSNIVIGDVDLNSSLANADITQLARSQAGKTTGIGYAGTEVEVYKVTE